MLKYMLDTNILIYTLKRKPPHVKARFEQHYGQMCISTVSYMEMVFGAERSMHVERNLRQIEGLAARLDILQFDVNAAAHTGQICAELAAGGKPIGPYDQMIAGHCRSQGLIMVTNNLNEFERVSGLRCENWV